MFQPSSDTPTLTDLDDPHSPSPDLTVSTTSSLSSKLYSQDLANSTSPTKLYPPTGVKEASLILLKEKNGRFALLREPLYLDKCIVYCDMEGEDYFELQEISTRDTFIFKVRLKVETVTEWSSGSQPRSVRFESWPEWKLETTDARETRREIIVFL